MSRTMFAIAFAGVIFTAASGTHAALILPLPAATTVGLDNLTDVSWRRCWHDRYGNKHCGRCWRDLEGRVHCS